MDNSAKLDEWNIIKKQIDSKTFKQKAGIQRIYWVNVGQNVGNEVYGKSEIFTRPVLIIKTFYNHTFLGVPLTSKFKHKRGKLYHKFIDSKGRIQTALLGQIRIFDTKRLETYISKIDDKNFKQIKEKIKRYVVE